MTTLRVGYSQKVGAANFGSRGATVELEVTLDGPLAEDRERLRERIAAMFRLARQSVTEELGRARASPAPGDGLNGQPVNGASPGAAGEARMATHPQARAIVGLCRRLGINLGEVLDRYAVAAPVELTLRQASALIDELKARSAAGS